MRGKVTADSLFLDHDGFEYGPDKISLNLAITPAKISGTTRVVEISGTIDSFFNLGGCKVSVTAVLGRRPG